MRRSAPTAPTARSAASTPGRWRSATPPPEVRAVLERCERLRARTRGCFDVHARGDARPVGLRQGLGRRDGGDHARSGRRTQPVRARRRRRARARRAGSRTAVARRDPASRGAATAWRPSCARAAWRWRPRAPTSAARTSSIRAPAAPRTGVASVTVLGPDLATADAYATAAFAMGVDGPAWTAVARRLRRADASSPTAACSRRPASTPCVLRRRRPRPRRSAPRRPR